MYLLRGKKKPEEQALAAERAGQEGEQPGSERPQGHGSKANLGHGAP